MCCQSAASSGSTSFMPRTAWIVGAPMRLCNRLDVDRLSFRLEVGRGRLAAVGRAYVIGNDLLEFLGDRVAFEGDGLLSIDLDRGDGYLARARKADADVGHLRFARAVDHTAHRGDAHGLDTGIACTPFRHLRAQVGLDLVGEFLEVGARGPSTAGT